MSVDIRLLGRFEVALDGTVVPPEAWVRRQASALVKVLAVLPGRVMHREQVLDALWPDLGPDEAAPRLHKAAHYARRALRTPSAVLLRNDVVALLPDADVTVDVVVFQQLAERASAGSPQEAEAAIAAYTGDLLPENLYEPWTETLRERLRTLHRDLLRRAGRWEDLIAADPADEEAHLALMQRYAESGDRRGALRQFERMDRALRQELGVGPSRTALALRERLQPELPRPRPASSVPPTPPVAPRAQPGLVGRRAETEELDRALSAAGRGHGRTVLVTGSAGIGKSTLLSWLRVQAAARGFRVGHGVAAAVEGAWPYAPVLEAFNDLCRQHPTLLDGLDDLYRTEIERALSGRELSWSGEGTHQRLFVAAAELLRLVAAGTGAVLVVDDLHDADDASLRLLHYLARAATDERVLLAAAYRQADAAHTLDQIRRSLIGRNAAVEFPLMPFDVATTHALIRQRLPVAPMRLAEQVHALTGGTPFSVGEFLHRVDADPATQRLDGTAVLTGMAPEVRDSLARVAVVGTTFDTDEFLALTLLDEAEAFRQLEAALAAFALESTGAGYRFRHRLVRDALLAGLPPHRLRSMHREAAERLAAVGASPARIGHHLLQAGRPADAVPHVLRAAETEAAVGAYRDALRLVDSVREQAGGADQARLLALRGDLLNAVGDRGAVEAYRQALAVAGGETRRVVQARLAKAAALTGDLDSAAAALDGLELLGDSADATILLARGNVSYFEGDMDAAWAAAVEARRRVPEDDSNWQLLELVTLQGMIAHNRGEWFERLRFELQSTRESPRLAAAVFDSHLCVAEYLLYGPTPYADVIELARSLRGNAERSGALRAVGFAATLIGEAALLGGDLDLAERELLEAIDLHHQLAAPAGEAHSLQRLAEVRLYQGRRAEAEALLRRALPVARWSPIANHLVQRIYGTQVLAAADTGSARAAVERGAAATGNEDLCIFCMIFFEVPATIACADAGDTAAARRHLKGAEKSVVRWAGTAWEAGLEEARAHIARAEGDPNRAGQLLEQAAELFDGAGQPLDAARCREGSAARLLTSGGRQPVPQGRVVGQ